MPLCRVEGAGVLGSTLTPDCGKGWHVVSRDETSAHTLLNVSNVER